MTDEGRLWVQGMPCMWVLAHAKINLSLEVLGRRDDGYHRVATVLHTVGLADRLSFDPSRSLSLECATPPVPAEQNMAMRAARLLQQRTGCTRGAAIALEKSIPVAAGLGGGSSDAAATLKALNVLWDLRLSRVRLWELATCLGSDVPFFLEGGCALAEGRGEVVTRLRPMTGWWAVILRPPFQLAGKTARLYGLLEEDDFTDGSATRRLARRLRAGTASMDEVKTGRNAFERVAAVAFPGLEEYRKAVLEAGASFARLAGSGPALYTLVEGQEEGAMVLKRLRDGGHEAYLARLAVDAGMAR